MAIGYTGRGRTRTPQSREAARNLGVAKYEYGDRKDQNTSTVLSELIKYFPFLFGQYFVQAALYSNNASSSDQIPLLIAASTAERCA